MIKRNLIFIIIIFIIFYIPINIKNNKINNKDYYGTIYIPKINLYKKFYYYNSPFNTVDKNIMIIDTGIKDTYLLAAHSGTGPIAYFNNLKNLKEKDLAYLTIDNDSYIYEVYLIRKEIKDGDIKIPNKENILILTTCDQINKGYQLIIECIKKN